jgi:hypothetical protein
MSRARRRTGDLAGAHDDMVEAVRLYESSPLWDARTLPRARIALAAIRAARGEAERAAEEFGRADAELHAVPGRSSIYDLRDRTVYLAASGDPAATFAAAREAVESGLHAAVLAVEPEVRALFADEPGLAALLGDD